MKRILYIVLPFIILSTLFIVGIKTMPKTIKKIENSQSEHQKKQAIIDSLQIEVLKKQLEN